MLLFIPLPYVDVTSSWRFGSKWQRVIVAAAGMYAEIFVAAIAAIVATQTGSDVIRHHAVNLMITAGIVTLLFNVNPLMRFDGYYILSDLIELPNLATHGQQDLLSLCRRWLLGANGEPPVWPEGRGGIVRIYGIAAFAWRILICVSLSMAAELLYHGAGIVLAAGAIVMWVIVPLFKFLRYLVVSDPIDPPNRVRLAAIAGSVTAIGFCVWNYVPYAQKLQFPAIVEYDPAVSVRAGTSGFVRETLVVPGQIVAAGQPLFRLENEQLAARIDDAILATEQSRLDATRYHRAGNLAAYGVELENEAALQTRLNELNARADQLTLVASISGTVISRGLDDLQDRWVTAGTEMLLVGNESERSIHFVIPQTDIDFVRRAALSNEQSVNVHIWGTSQDRLNGKITDVAPRGSTVLRYPALSVPAGGPLAVRPASAAGSQTRTDWELLETHFVGHIRLPNQQLESMGSGQTGIVELRTIRGSLGDLITEKMASVLRSRHLTN